MAHGDVVRVVVHPEADVLREDANVSPTPTEKAAAENFEMLFSCAEWSGGGSSPGGGAPADGSTKNDADAPDSAGESGRTLGHYSFCFDELIPEDEGIDLNNL